LERFADCFWLLWDGDRLVSMVNGMASDEYDLRDEMFHDADLHQPDGDWLMIFGVATIPEYQRQGCAGQVLRQAIEDTRMLGRKGVVLTCKKFRIPYYATFGFVDEGVSQSEHGGAVWHQMRITF
jgi:GNAT superfamily N-acetyltransferase